MSQRYIIIGTSVAGYAAAETIRETDSHAEILLIGEETHKFYSRPGLAYYLTGELPENQLFLPQEKQFKRKHARVTTLHPQEHKITLDSGETLAYDRLLLATGSTAAKVPMIGGDLEGVVKIDNLNDVRIMLKLIRKSKRAVVVGGGITALEVVEGFRARGLKTYYLLRSQRYWRNVLDTTESSIVEQRLAEEGVELRYNTQIAQITAGKRNRVNGVDTKDGQHIKCEMVAVAVGVRPRKELAEQAGLKTDRGIMVDEYMQTSSPDIFAAGDVAQIFDPYSGKYLLDALWSASRQHGTFAGQNMAGATEPHVREIALNVTRLAGLTTTIIGAVGTTSKKDEDLLAISRGDSETWREMPDSIAAQTNFDVNRLRIVISQNHIAGAIIMGDQTLSMPLYNLIINEVDIAPIHRQITHPTDDVKLADLLADFWTKWRNENGTS